ncbi:hypothetical protein FRC08_002322 [Ceratobasidium sp. 394]|nr:hypothetical protein FRC08_002322 [Ceratobasidium sp. 394]
MTLLGQHEATDTPAAWGMFSPSYAHSTIPVAQGKEHLRSATSALMSLQSEATHTLDQYAHPRQGERPPPTRSASGSQEREEWAARTQSLLRLDSAPHQNVPFSNSGSYLQGAHRWAATASPPSTPTSAPADNPQQASYLSAPPASQHPSMQYSNLVTHAPQPVHAQSAAGGSQFLAMHSSPFPSSLSPPNISRQTDSVSSTSSLPPSLRRRSSPSASGSASSSNTITAASLGLNFGDARPRHTSEASLSKLARSRNTFNLTNSTTQAPREKPKLLSKDQKKKNHIHSEQKRRATIRKGYALLCEEVPSLRMAIAAAEADDAEQTGDGDGRRRRRSRGRASTTDGERIDGRAGPRSESVVLVKTIDHLKDLLASRQELVARVQELRAGGLGGDSPWERNWDGGTGLAPEGDGDEEDDGEDDGDGESDEVDDQ